MRIPWRLSLLLAALFAALTCSPTEPGLALGTIAAVREHDHYHGLVMDKADDDAGLTDGNGEDGLQR